MKNTRYYIKNKRGEVIFYLIINPSLKYKDVFSVSLTYDNNVLIITDIVASVSDLQTIYQHLLEKTENNDLKELIKVSVEFEKFDLKQSDSNEINKQIKIVKQKLLNNENS